MPYMTMTAMRLASLAGSLILRKTFSSRLATGWMTHASTMAITEGAM